MMPLADEAYMNASISAFASDASDASAASFLAARTRLSARWPCRPQNFLAAGVSTVHYLMWAGPSYSGYSESDFQAVLEEKERRWTYVT